MQTETETTQTQGTATSATSESARPCDRCGGWLCQEQLATGECECASPCCCAEEIPSEERELRRLYGEGARAVIEAVVARKAHATAKDVEMEIEARSWSLYDVESGDILDVTPTLSATLNSMQAPEGVITVDLDTGDYVPAQDVDTLMHCQPAPNLTLAYVLED